VNIVEYVSGVASKYPTNTAAVKQMAEIKRARADAKLSNIYARVYKSTPISNQLLIALQTPLRKINRF
jgi:hypothetical protein